MGRDIALHRIGGDHVHVQQRRQQTGFKPVGTPGAVSFDAAMTAFERTFDSVMRDSNAATRQGELLSALDGLFSTAARARASATDCQPIERTLLSTLLEHLLLRKFSLNRELEKMKLAVIEYLFQLEQQHLRGSAASLVRSTWVQMASTRADVCDDMLSAVVGTIVRTCESYPAQSIQLFSIVEATTAKRQFHAALLERLVQMLGPTPDVASAQSAASTIMTLCEAAAAKEPDSRSDGLPSDALAAVEDLTLSLARLQFQAISYWNVYTMHAQTAASVKIIEQLLQSLGKLTRAHGATSADIRQAMAI